MGAERAQGGRGWVRIPASRGEQPPPAAAGKPYGPGQYGAGPYGGNQQGTGQYGGNQQGTGQYGGNQQGAGQYGGNQQGAGQYGAGRHAPGQPGQAPYGSGRHGSGPYAANPFRGPGPHGPAGAGAGDTAEIYLSLVKRWREAGRTLPGHPDEEWERLISQPCWPGR
ncbi:hypothetical protein [Streptomyces sp. NPDC029721]|uniref:hypothetical protein n=1 Tax=Streptomyces sp. NPDC029721 TaxID=3157090 RepID=UPI0033C814A2